MNLWTKIFVTAALLALAVFSEGLLILPAFAALLYLWGIETTK